MVKRLTVLALSLTLAAMATPAMAQRGSERVSGKGVFVRRCVHRITSVADRSAHVIGTTAGRCSHLIRALVEEGNQGMAEELARHCAAHVDAVANHGIRVIRRVTEHCLSALESHGAPDDVLGLIKDVAMKAAEAIDMVRARALGAIQDALGG